MSHQRLPDSHESPRLFDARHVRCTSSRRGVGGAEAGTGEVFFAGGPSAQIAEGSLQILTGFLLAF